MEENSIRKFQVTNTSSPEKAPADLTTPKKHKLIFTVFSSFPYHLPLTTYHLLLTTYHLPKC